VYLGHVVDYMGGGLDLEMFVCTSVYPNEIVFL